ncbi:MAG: hypothetical protein O4808_08605 [Trichodesmium sp. St17_bin3_1_1]|jgi:hypothetical protein|nr:hypothetical protein [Trichodesmium sp. St17_bin3_1_1]
MTKFQIKPSQPQPLHNEKEETESKNPYGELSVIELESIVGGWKARPWPWDEPHKVPCGEDEDAKIEEDERRKPQNDAFKT